MTVVDTSAAAAAVAEPTAAASKVSLFRRLLHRPLAVASMAFLFIVIVLVIFAPVVAPYSPTSTDLLHTLRHPSAAHWLGTDSDGRDVLSRLLYGGRVSLLGTLVAVATSVVVGVPAGLVAGYAAGRWPDSVVSRIGDIVIALPAIITLLCVLAVFPQNENAAMFALGLLFSAGLMRIVRGSTIAVRNDLYVDAARVAGLSQIRLLKRHILPRVKGAVIVMVSLLAALSLVAEAGLGFLGLGVAPPQASWGSMVAEAQSVVFQDGWLLVPPGVTLGLTVLAFALIGDALADVGRGASARALPSARQRRSPAVAPDEAPAGTNPDALLSVSDVSVAFLKGQTSTTVVSNVSLEVGRGEILGIVGESGCGKSVTAASISNVLPANGYITSGSVVFDGKELVGLSERELRSLRGSEIAIIPQEPMAALDPAFSVGYLLTEAVKHHRGLTRSQARRQALALLEMARLPNPRDVAARYPHQLSGGMAQRVVIAFALAGQPRLLIADEPTTALDVTVQAEILDLLHRLQRETSMSIIVVSHDWGVIADLCDRAVVMYAGQVVECAEVADMFRAPHHPYTAGLLASNPHLALDGEKLPTIPGTVPSPEAWPEGCHFSPRCKYATAECRQPVELRRLDGGRTVRCIHHELVEVGQQV